jgi:hypothetical protein
MRAARILISNREFRLVDIPVPTPGPGQIRIQVRAAGVDAAFSEIVPLENIREPLDRLKNKINNPIRIVIKP